MFQDIQITKLASKVHLDSVRVVYAQASWVNGDIVNYTENQPKMVLESGISVEVFPIPENTNAATVTGLVRSFSTSFFSNRESLSIEINLARSRSSNYIYMYTCLNVFSGHYCHLAFSRV